ncbi:hypothetical protein F5Y06DRAFT_306576 [Hypoxylon sp. FL0890]|nr:hypothetical protein F5Y06DRAFT_306576 [Hypoxylon sp. FL0890]
MKPTYIAFLLAGTAAPVFGAAVARQGSDDTPDLYLCSNPDFSKDCQDCACESLADVITVPGYGGPPCFQLPEDLRVGAPQGVSSAKAYSQWNCTLYDNDSCENNGPQSTFNVPPGPPGVASMGYFDDKAVAYRCFVLE